MSAKVGTPLDACVAVGLGCWGRMPALLAVCLFVSIMAAATAAAAAAAAAVSFSLCFSLAFLFLSYSASLSPLFPLPFSISLFHRFCLSLIPSLILIVCARVCLSHPLTSPLPLLLSD